MNRRAALAALAAAAAAVSCDADSPKLIRLGLLASNPAHPFVREWTDKLRQALRAYGWNPESIQFVVRATADELVRENVAVLLAESTGSTLELRRATTRIPIVTAVADPVSTGLAKSLRAPGTNVTGLAYAPPGEVAGKRFELLRAIVPGLVRVGIFGPPRTSATRQWEGAIHDAGSAQGLEVIEIEVRSLEEFSSAIRKLRGKPRAAAQLYMYFPAQDETAAAVAIENGIAMSCNEAWSVEAGGLLYYELEHVDEPQRFAAQINKILRGEDPANIPFELPTASRLIVNRATARKLGLEIPRDVLVRSEKVIG